MILVSDGNSVAAGKKFDLTGEVALVTGATSGIGWQLAKVLARAGAHVAVTGRRTERLEELVAEIEAFDGRALPIMLDVTDYPSIENVVAVAEAELGPISVLINNSGVSNPKPTLKVTFDDYDFEMDTNAKGAFFVAQAVAKRMIEHKIKGRIINIASIGGIRVLGQLAVYCMSKAAIIQMTKVMATEWARKDIAVNAICPGYIETEMNSDFFQSELGEVLINQMPQKKLGPIDGMDRLVLMLASEDSGFITGAAITADGAQVLM